MMSEHKKQTDFCGVKLLSLSSKSKVEFTKEYKKYDETSTRELYLRVLIELKKAIFGGNINKLKNLSNAIDYISSIENQATLKCYFDNVDNPIKTTNLVILACKHNNMEILKCVFSNYNHIFNNLSINIGRTILPEDEDEACHNAFYYALRSGNVKLLDTLIKWPDNYFAVHVEKMDEILSRAYEELKLKNISLLEVMEIFVENKLINLRFFSKTSEQDQSVKHNPNNIRERIELVLQNISLLKAEYLNKVVDEKFLFIAKFIAQNIHILKQQLKSTYDRLPWEEVEFCLTSFVSSRTKRQEMNLFYHTTLDKGKTLNHLENFAKKLEEERGAIEGVIISKRTDLPKLKREKVIPGIISNYHQFEELYNDYQQIRDVHSLEKINSYIKLALSVCPKEREGQLIITRVLQVIGEYLKNTWESPKLSNTTSELFLLSLPKNTREVIIDLRNSLSHAYSLSMRTEIEENKDVNFFIGVQNDTKKVGDVITDILYNNKIKMIRILLKKVSNSENLDEIKEVSKILDNVELDKKDFGNFKMMEHEKLERLIKELSDTITDKTNYEEGIFNKINEIINVAKTKENNIKTDYVIGLASLKVISATIDLKEDIDHNDIREMKINANNTINHLVPQIECHSLKDIAELSMRISRSVMSRINPDKIDEINRLIYKIFYIAESGTGDIKWIEKLRGKLNKKGCVIPTNKERKTYNVTEENFNNQLALKLSELKSILSKNSLNGQTIEKLPSYKSDKKLQAVVEMLVLDIMSILASSKNYLENNLLYLDDNTPLLTGKCLRNHLAHDNTLLDVLLSDPSIAVILNAKKLTEENIMKSKKKIGKLVSDDPFKLREKYDQGLVLITNQERMFVALEEGNLENVKDCLKNGADINARNINLWTTLHFAAKGPSLEVVKFILDQISNVDVKDINGQSPLHIAASYGRKSIVEFFVEEASLFVEDVDSYGKTVLHIAAQYGHKQIVEVLLKSKAYTVARDMVGLSPLFYAIRNNHIDVAKILLGKYANVDIHETKGGFTPLHEAADSGHLELVNYLLENRADIGTKNDRDFTPLHSAAYKGHLQVVNALVLKGADANARDIYGCTPLWYAVEYSHEEIANILLRHGANVNVVNKTFNTTPLHYAAAVGHEGIVKTLLENKANANVADVNGMTPLHFAVQGGHLKMVTVFLKHGINIHTKDKNNATPLYYAANSGHKEIAELLIKNGAEIDAKTNDDCTPLYVAALEGHKDITYLLINNKANVNARDILGNTALHAAAMNGNTDVIELLIKNKATVNARSNDGITPLHDAALNGHRDAIVVLIKNKAEVNTIANFGVTPLYACIIGGHKDIVKLLVENKAQVNARGIADITPLHVAVEAGHKEVIQILIANGANVNAKSGDNFTPLLSAIKCNYKDVVEVLIANGANVNVEDGEPLSHAVLAGHADIIEILIKNNACINMKYTENATLLHLAATRGHKEVVNILIKKGADVNAITLNNMTPLCFAAHEGYEEVVEILIANRASVNVKTNDGFTPLHMAATSGHSNVVKLLLDNDANVHVKDDKCRTPLELAVANGHLQVVKMILQYEKVDINAKCNNDLTLLLIAAQESNLEIIKYLINEGSDINARNAYGSKAIHIAAREGHKDIVEFFLSKGSSINDLGADNQNLLHYAAMKGHLEIVKYLIAQGANINTIDANGLSPMHIAAHFGFSDIVEVLLKNGAVYNYVDKFNRKPSEISNNKYVINLLTSTEKLFAAVKHNRLSEVENCIRAGAFVNAKNADDGVTSLHYASWKGYDDVVNVLLQNKANPNAVGNKGITPLHYAAKFSHLETVKALLSNGAIYNAVSDSGKTPSDFTVDTGITSLFKIVSESFKNIKYGNLKVINELNKIEDLGTMKAIMSARNTEHKTLIVAAMHNSFSKVDKLKEVLQGDVSTFVDLGLMFAEQSNFQQALSILKDVFKIRKEILGPDNPGTLDIQTCIAKVLYKQGVYQDALNILEEIFHKQKEILGENNKDTLSTRSFVALILHKQGTDEKALNIFREVYQRQKEILRPDDPDILSTEFHMAMVLARLGEHDEALSINRAVFKKKKNSSGVNDPIAVRAQNNIAMVLNYQGKYEEALEIYKEVYERKKIVFGIDNYSTLGTLLNIAGILISQKKYGEAVKAHREVLNIQKKVLGANHPDTLLTQCNLANVFFNQGKWFCALKAYTEGLDQLRAVFGPEHPNVLDSLNKIERMNLYFKLEGSGAPDVLQHLQRDINNAASNGDIQTVQRLLKDGVDANDKDINGRTPLHYAVSSGQIGVVSMLLKNGADVTQVTNKGNTPLHTATSQSNGEMIDILLQHVSRDKSNDFINAKTIGGGTTSLHVAAKNGSVEIVKSLLKHGANYDIEDKGRKKPLDLSNDQNVISLLKLVEELFEKVEKGDVEIIKKLRAVKPGELLAITNARNNEGNTLLQVTILGKHKNITGKLLEMLKKSK